MRRFYRNYIESNGFFWFFSIIGVIMMIAGFILPPIGQIDNSVLIGVGEIDGIIALGTVIKSIDKGRSATFHHNGTELTINSNEDEEEGE